MQMRREVAYLCKCPSFIAFHKSFVVSSFTRKIQIVFVLNQTIFKTGVCYKEFFSSLSLGEFCFASHPVPFDKCLRCKSCCICLSAERCCVPVQLKLSREFMFVRCTVSRYRLFFDH